MKNMNSQENVLSEDYNMMVTPKEIDFILENLVEVIADSINLTLHEALSKK